MEFVERELAACEGSYIIWSLFSNFFLSLIFGTKWYIIEWMAIKMSINLVEKLPTNLMVILCYFNDYLYKIYFNAFTFAD